MYKTLLFSFFVGAASAQEGVSLVQLKSELVARTVDDSENCAACIIWGDNPRIISFDANRKRASQHPQAEAFFRTRDWKTDELAVGGEGVFWLVNSQQASIQARYRRGDNVSRLKSLVITGPFINNTLFQIHTLGWNITWNEQVVLDSIGSNFSNKYINASFLANSEAVSTGKRGPALEIDLPNGISLTVNRWTNSLAAKISMCHASAVQDGQCGNNNGDVADDTPEFISERIGGHLPLAHSLFPADAEDLALEKQDRELAALHNSVGDFSEEDDLSDDDKAKRRNGKHSFKKAAEEVAYSMAGEARCRPEEPTDGSRIDDWVYNASKFDAEKACESDDACRGFHWQLTDSAYVLVNAVGPIVATSETKGHEECFVRPGAEVEGGAPAEPPAPLAEEVEGEAPAEPPAALEEVEGGAPAEGEAALAEAEDGAEKMTYAKYGEGRCTPHEPENGSRIGEWVYGASKQDAQQACDDAWNCMGIHWNNGDASYILVTAVGPLGDNSELGEICYAKPGSRAANQVFADTHQELDRGINEDPLLKSL